MRHFSWIAAVMIGTTAAAVADMVGDSTRRGEGKVTTGVDGGNGHEFAIPPGEYPRLLFRQQGIQAIRDRAATPEGQRLVEALHGIVNRGGHVHLLQALADEEPEAVAFIRGEIPLSSRGSFPSRIFHATVIYIATGDETAQRALLTMLRQWMATFPGTGNLDHSGPQRQLYISGVWGDWSAALTVDVLYHALSEAERQRALEIFAELVALRVNHTLAELWWLDGLSRSGDRNFANWSVMTIARLGMTNMLLEGQPGYSEVLARRKIEMMDRFLKEGIAPDGGVYDGMEYPLGNFGFHQHPYYLMALRLRGIDLIHAPNNQREVFQWVAHEMLPWGHEGQGVNKANGHFRAGPFATFLAHAFADDALTRWLFVHLSGWGERRQYNAAMALLHGIPDVDFTRDSGPRPPVELPLAHWFSTLGRVIVRSAWDPHALHFSINSNSLGAGHSHADHGSFTLASHGANFFRDSGANLYDSVHHNLVHIDGKGQHRAEGATESFIRWAELSDYATVVDMDLQLAYSRVQAGGNAGPWHWEAYNPVEKADRRALVVQGVTGPLLALADDIRKDNAERLYEWLGRTEINNTIRVDGSAFTIKARYGGDFVQSLGSGQTCTFVAEDVAAGRYRGWLLVRGRPYPSQWSNTRIEVNGVPIPYHNRRIGLGDHRAGWSWIPLLRNRPDGDSTMELDAGPLRVELQSVSGGQVAMAVFTRDPDWQPGFDIPEDGGDVVVMGVDALEQGAEPWAIGNAPQGILEGVFLGDQPPRLDVATAPLTGLPVLKATLRTSHARYLAVMVPSDARAHRAIQKLDAHTVMITGDQGMDIVAGCVDGTMTTGVLGTDAVMASVSLKQADVQGFAIVEGRMLRHAQDVLVESADGAVTVIHDGSRLRIRGAGGTRLKLARLGASTLIVNDDALTMPEGTDGIVHVAIPRPLDDWEITVSADEARVDVMGDGPLPLTFHAPNAVDVRINGVSRHFVRDADGFVWPALRKGTQLYHAQ